MRFNERSTLLQIVSGYATDSAANMRLDHDVFEANRDDPESVYHHDPLGEFPHSYFEVPVLCARLVRPVNGMPIVSPPNLDKDQVLRSAAVAHYSSSHRDVSVPS